MWCPECQTDVATEVDTDGQSLLCASCGAEIRKIVAPSLHPDIKQARDLLQRLGSPAADDDGAPEPALNIAPEEPSPRIERVDESPLTEPEIAGSAQFRVDTPHPTARPKSSTRAPVPPQHPPEAGHWHRDDAGHAMPAPHFEVTAPMRPAPGKQESLWGQLLAYLGVAVVTVGTALVLWGYFGGPGSYAPTGWLVATAGQMLMFLGVVTLISGGMQQTTHEVAARVAFLDGRMVRIEQTAHELLHGPHFDRQPARDSQFNEDTAATTDGGNESSRQ